MQEPPPDGLPPRLHQPPLRYYDWARPTAWLLGSQLLGGLNKLVFSQIHRGFDVRDWMTGGDPRLILARLDVETAPDRPFVVDYLADTGDSPRLVYFLARLLQRRQLTARLVGARGGPITEAFTYSERFDRWLSSRGQAPSSGEPGEVTLPRGGLLVIGGDSAYPISDKRALTERFQAPFYWAGQAEGVSERVPLVGLPGNHDYYDMLDGFLRQFRRPIGGERPVEAKGGKSPDLGLPGYERIQEASYQALDLPHGWKLWLLDIERGNDLRQTEYFRRHGDGKPPEKLIVCTSRPVIVQRKQDVEVWTGRGEPDKAWRDAHPLGATFRDLGLVDAFTGQLPASALRLDLSGDMHLYERYYGTTLADVPVPGRDGHAEARANHATVVCGLGGVFHHAEQVQRGTIGASAAWPTPRESAKAIGSVLMQPRKIFQAGAADVVGVLLALAMYALPWFSARETLVQLAGRAPLDLAWLVRLGKASVFVVACSLPLVGAGLAVAAGRWVRARVGRLRQGRAPVASAFWAQVIHRAQTPFRYLGITWRSSLGFTGQAVPWLLPVGAFYGLHHLWAWPPLGLEQDGAGGDLVTATLFLLLVGGLGLYLSGARGWRLAPAFLFATAHAFLQLVTPFAWGRMALEWPWVVAATVVVYLLWTKVLPQILRLPRGPRALAVIVAWAGLAGLLVYLPASLLSHAPPRGGWEWLAVAVAGATLSCLWLGWYLLASLQVDLHGNEAGSVARIDDYGAFLRIVLHADRAEVYAIRPRARFVRQRPGLPEGHYEVDAEVFDHFEIRR